MWRVRIGWRNGSGHTEEPFCLCRTIGRADRPAGADKTVELSEKGTRSFRGGYADFKRERGSGSARRRRPLHKKQQQQKRKLEEAIRRYREWYAKAHATAGERNPFLKKRAEKNRSRFQAKEKGAATAEKEKVERPKEDPRVHIRFEKGCFWKRAFLPCSSDMISPTDRRRYSGELLFRGEPNLRLLLAPNGSGKSTLLKLIAGKLPPRSNGDRSSGSAGGLFCAGTHNLKEHETIF